MLNQPPAPVQMISIFDILPDPAQPRRPIPQRILAGWDGSPHTTAQQIFDPCDENNLAYKDICKRGKFESVRRITDSPASDIADPTNILSDRAYQKKLAQVWRDMVQKRRVSHQLIDEIEGWLRDVRAEYGES